MLMDMNNQQFIDDRRLVRLNLVDTVKWRSIDPGDLIGEYDYRPASPLLDPAVNKEVRRGTVVPYVAGTDTDGCTVC